MENIGDRIKRLREEKGMTQEELAKYINSTKQTIYKYENSIVMNIPSDKIENIAKALDVSPSDLMGWECKKELGGIPEILSLIGNEKERYYVPILGRVAAGMPIEAIEDIVDYEEITEPIIHCFLCVIWLHKRNSKAVSKPLARLYNPTKIPRQHSKCVLKCVLNKSVFLTQT